MRNEYQLFTSRGAEILAVGPDGPNAFRKYWAENDIPFVGLPDLRSRVAKLYEQEFNLFKYGRMPLVSVIDRDGLIRYAHYGTSMSDIPSNKTLLEVIDSLNAASG